MNASWILSGNTARLQHRAMTASVDLANPQQGLHSVQVEGRFWPEARLLGVDVQPQADVALSLTDAWVRNGDLVAVYEQTGDRPYRVQIYWRAVDTPAGFSGRAVDLQVSVQTNLLDVDATISTHSLVSAGEVGICGLEGVWTPLRTSAERHHEQLPCWIASRNDGGGVYAEMVHPSDAQHDQWHIAGNDVTFEHRLFQRELEKGVILRARLRGVLLPEHEAAHCALAWFGALVDAPLPLTT